MRGLVLVIVYFSALPFIFISGPFWGILMWYWIALMNPERAIWNSVFLAVPYSYIVAVATMLAWLLSQREPKFPPFNKTSVLLVALAFWVSITSIFGTGPTGDIYYNWQLAEKMLLMTFVAYALTTTRPRLDQLIVVCTLSIGFWGVKGGLFSLMTGGRFRVYGPTGTMTGDNNDLGVALTMILPMMFYLWGRYRQPFLKWPILAMIGLTFIGDILPIRAARWWRCLPWQACCGGAHSRNSRWRRWLSLPPSACGASPRPNGLPGWERSTTSSRIRRRKPGSIYGVCPGPWR